MYSGLGYSSYHIGEPSLISKLLLPCVYDTIINPREGYGSCPVCVSVCLSVRNLNLGTGASRGLNEGTSE